WVRSHASQVRTAIGTRMLASLSPLEIQAAYRLMARQSTRSTWSKSISNHFCEKLVSRNIRLYDLRHTSATLALTVGVPPKVVSEQLGHASAAFTLDTYSHVLPHMQDEAAAKMEAALMNSLSL